METAIRELMGAGTPPRFKFKDTHASIEFPSGYTIPTQATLEAKYDELLALEEDIQKTVMEGDLEVGTSNLFVDTQTGNIGIGTDNPGYTLDVAGGVGIAGDLNIGGETILGTATYRKRRDWDRSALAYVYLGNVRTNDTTGIRLDVSLNNANSGYTMYQFQITLNGNDSDHSGGQLVYSSQGTNNNSIARSIEIGYAYVGTSGIYEYQLWLKDPTTSTVGNMDAYLNCQGYYNFDTGVSDVAHGGSAPTNFNSGIVGVLVDAFGNVGIGTTDADYKLHIRSGTATALLLESDNGGTGYPVNIDFRNYDAQDPPGARISVIDDADYGSDITFNTKTGSPGTGSLSQRMIIQGDGNVGIGVTSPSSRLHVNLGNASGEQHIRATQTSLASSTAGIRFGDSTWDAFIDHSHGSKDLMNFGFYRNPTRQVNMVLSHEGNVGIGTTNPNGNLHIMSDLANASSQINPSAQLVLHSSLAGLDDDGDIGASLVFTQRWLDSSPNSHGTMGSIHGFKDLSAGNYGGGLLFKTQPGSDTAPVERMRIDRDGNVGIGLTSPVYTLDVNGVSRSRGVCVNSGFGNGTARPALTTGSTHPSYEIRSIGGNGNVGSAGGDDGFLRLRAGGGTGTNSASYIDLSGYSTYSGGDMKRNIVFGTLGTERMRIKENGNVGIGESSPSYKLDVNGDTRVGNVLYIGKNTNDETAKTIYFGGTYGDNGYDHCVIERRVWSTGTEKQELLLFSGNDGENDSGPDRIRLKGAQILFDTLNSSTDRTTENTKMIIRADGDVGIGTTNPQTKLHVNGEISNNNPGCRVGQNATQYTLPSSSTNVLKYNYVFYDTGSDYSTSTGLFTCPVAGKYLCIHMMTSRSTRTRSAISETKIFWNGVEVSRQFMDVTQDSSTGTVIIDAAVNDTLNAGIWNGNSNNEYNGINDGGGSQFFVHFLG
jgi:hypothetical protein